MSKQSLLLVDGDTRSLRVLEVSLRKAGFDVTSAASVDEASEALTKQLPDLIVSETTFPAVADGFAFRDHVRANPQWADIPFVFLTAETALENKIRGLELGVDDYLTKPIYIKEVVARINILLHKRQRAEFSKHSDGVHFSGRLTNLPVVDVIQTLEVSRKSGVIQFVAGQRRASIYFRDGKVIDAEAGTLQGEDAVYRLLTWNDGDFEVVFRTVRRREVIAASSQALLMEGMRRLDEWTRLLEDLPPLTHRFALDTVTLAERLGDIPDENNPILRLFDGKRSLLEVIEASNIGDLECLQAISRLYFEGLLLDPERTDEVRYPLPRVPESSGPVLTSIASTYSAADTPGSRHSSEEQPPASTPPPEPVGSAVAMKLIEEAVAAVQADDIPTIEVRPPLLPAAPLARVRLATREIDPRIANARSTVERLRIRKTSPQPEVELRGGFAPEVPAAIEPPGASPPTTGPGPSSDREPSADAAATDARSDERAVETISTASQPTPALEVVPVATELLPPIVDAGSDSAAAAAPEAKQPHGAEVDAGEAEFSYLVEEGESAEPGETPRLRMIGSHGRERATAAGELIPAEPSAAQPPARELITIMPRRITRSPIPSTVIASNPVATPPVEANPRRAVAAKLPEPSVAEGIRQTTGSQSIVMALVVLAACLIGVAITMHWGNDSHDRSQLAADTASHGPSQTANPASSPVEQPLTPIDAEPNGIAPGHAIPAQVTPAQVTPAQVTPAQVTPAQAIPAQAPPPRMDPAPQERQISGAAAVAVGPAKPESLPAVTTTDVRDAGIPLETQDAAVDPVAEARRLFERARAALEEGDAHKALAFAAASLKLRKTARTYLEYARALQRLGQTDAALGAVDSAIQIVPTYAPSWSQRGMILWATRRRSEARLAFQKYLELDPNGRDAVSVRQMLSQP